MKNSFKSILILSLISMSFLLTLKSKIHSDSEPLAQGKESLHVNQKLDESEMIRKMREAKPLPPPASLEIGKENVHEKSKYESEFKKHTEFLAQLKNNQKNLDGEIQRLSDELNRIANP